MWVGAASAARTHRALLGHVAVVKRHVAAAAQAAPRLLQRVEQELHKPCVDTLVRLYALTLGMLWRGVHLKVEEGGRREHEIGAVIVGR